MLQKIGKDKWKHFFVGIAMGAILQGFFSYLLALDRMPATWMALALAIVICYGFELFSLVTGKGHYEVLDAIAGIIGSMLGMGIYWLFFLL